MALRSLRTRVARTPRVRQMGRGSRSFFTVALSEALSNKKPIGSNTQRCVVLESTPATSFEVSRAEFLLEVLILPLDTPAHLGDKNQALERRVWGESRRPIFEWLCIPSGHSIGSHCSSRSAERQ